MTHRLLFFASFFLWAGCDGIWDSYLGPRPGLTADGGVPTPDAGMMGGPDCTASASCPATQWCNTAVGHCETLPTLRAVWMSDASTVWVAGDGGLLLKLPQATSTSPKPVWQVFPRVVNNQLNSIHGLSATDVWSVGNGGVILHFDGSAWTSITSPVPGKDLFGVFSVVANSTIHRRAVGISGTRIGVDGTGTTWTQDTKAIGMPTLYSALIAVLAGVYRTWAVGQSGALQSEPQASGWQDEPALPMTTDMYSIIYNGSDLVAVGKSGLVFTRAFTGGWNQVASNTNQNLGGVSSTGQNNIWAAGDNNTVIHYDGMQFSANNCTFTPTNFWGIVSNSATNVWAVGENGVVCYFNGTAWVDRGLRN